MPFLAYNSDCRTHTKSQFCHLHCLTGMLTLAQISSVHFTETCHLILLNWKAGCRVGKSEQEGCWSVPIPRGTSTDSTAAPAVPELAPQGSHPKQWALHPIVSLPVCLPHTQTLLLRMTTTDRPQLLQAKQNKDPQNQVLGVGTVCKIVGVGLFEKATLRTKQHIHKCSACLQGHAFLSEQKLTTKDIRDAGEKQVFPKLLQK